MSGLVRIDGRRNLPGYSNGTPTYIGTPQGGYLGPGYGVGVPGYGGIGVTTGPLLPGQTINVPIGGN